MKLLTDKVLEKNTFGQVKAPGDIVEATLEKNRKGWAVYWIVDPDPGSYTASLSGNLDDLCALPSTLLPIIEALKLGGTVSNGWKMYGGMWSAVTGIKNEATARRIYAFICTYMELVLTAAPSGQGRLEFKDSFCDIRDHSLETAQ